MYSSHQRPIVKTLLFSQIINVEAHMNSFLILHAQGRKKDVQNGSIIPTISCMHSEKGPVSHDLLTACKLSNKINKITLILG
jgi:hypothetical protein